MSALSDLRGPLFSVLQAGKVAIAEGDLGSALDAIRDFANDVICNPRSTDNVLFSRELDEICEAVASAARTEPVNASAQRYGTVILTTELVQAGGHIELIKDYLRLGLFEAPVTLVLTDVLGRADPALNADFARDHRVEVLCAQGARTGDRFISLLSYIDRVAPKEIITILYNHDSLGVAAALASNVPRLIFTHVGDYQLSLGVTIKAFVHVDLTAAVHSRCQSACGLTGSLYWPLTVRADALTPPSRFMSDNTLTTCCSGRYAKFVTMPYRYSYVRMIPALLSATGGQHIHIGEFPPEAVESVRQALVKEAIDPDCFVVIPYVPSLATALRHLSVDLYLTSFPIGGAKATIEAMAAGIPLLMHRNYRSPSLDNIDLVYPDALQWSSESEFSTCLRTYTPEELLRQSGLSRKHFETFYGDANLVDAVRHPGSVSAPSLRSGFEPDALQVFLDNEASIDGNAKLRLATLEVEHIHLYEEYKRILEAYNTVAARMDGAVSRADYDVLQRGYEEVLASYNALLVRMGSLDR